MELTTTLKRKLAFFGAGALCFALSLLFTPPASVLLSVLAYVVVGHDVLLGAARNILRGRVFDELFLMSVATLGALVIGRYEEAVGVMAFYKIGEALQESASAKSRSSVAKLLARRPSVARLRRGEEWVGVDPDEAKAGDLFMVMPGERVPLDGDVVEGECFVDASALTGESLPRRVEPGSDILAGYVAIDGSFTAIARGGAKESTAARIIGIVERASRSKA